MLNIVLVEPEIPSNTGNIARTCAVTGARLHLVEPLGFSISDKALKRAGLDYWKALDITVYPNLEAFFEKNQGQFVFASTKAKKVYTEYDYAENTYLVFGSETRGLDEKLLSQNYSDCVRIPMLPTMRSLNLSNAVAVIVYEVLRRRGFAGLEGKGSLRAEKEIN
jgi:tRNA (cytidine/uridine-2'-O-)-methyltransferase